MPCQGPWGGGYGGNSYRKDYLEAERRLCEARWIILRLCEHHAPPRSLAALIAKHRAEQLEHRQGDRKHAIEAIRQTLDRLHDDETEIRRRGGTPSVALLKQRDTLKKERQRIQAITAEQLLADYWGSETRLPSDLVDHEDED